jgi:hypothetical protein
VDRHGWAGRCPPDTLGAVAHGPAILARTGTVTAGLRCAFAYPQGIELLIVLAAVDVHADAASMHTFPRPDAVGHEPWSGLQVTVEFDGRIGGADPFQSESSGGGDRFAQECRYFLDPLPADPRLLIAVAWPQIGLTEHRTELRLDLHDIPGRSLPLLTEH